MAKLEKKVIRRYPLFNHLSELAIERVIPILVTRAFGDIEGDLGYVELYECFGGIYGCLMPKVQFCEV